MATYIHLCCADAGNYQTHTYFTPETRFDINNINLASVLCLELIKRETGVSAGIPVDMSGLYG